MERSKVAPVKPTKKSQILALHETGITDIQHLAERSHSRPSYVAAVLQNAGLLDGYFDLYTRSAKAMNIYSPLFAGRLGFRTPQIAQASVEYLEEMHERFQNEKDPAGQHHTLIVALTLLDRARWSQKRQEAGIFRDWLVSKLELEAEDGTERH
jgi:hypothetical protein